MGPVDQSVRYSRKICSNTLSYFVCFPVVVDIVLATSPPLYLTTAVAVLQLPAARACNTTADLRGFTITEEALTSLVSNNGQLREITLPGGCSRNQLQPLRRLTALQRMTLEAPTGDITECLPENLRLLDIAGE